MIDAAGLVVAPGFIDMMGQTASPMMDDPKTAINLLTQGITTINAGEGGSAAPLGDEEGDATGYTTMAEYFTLVESKGLPVNVVQTVGHTQVRRIVLGDVDRRPSDEELKQMQESGPRRDGSRRDRRFDGIDLSAGRLCSDRKRSRRLLRSPVSTVDATTRTCGTKAIGCWRRSTRHSRSVAKASTPVHIFHLKAAGQQNWGKMQLAIARDQGRASQRATSDRRHLSLHQQRTGYRGVDSSAAFRRRSRIVCWRGWMTKTCGKRFAARWRRPKVGRTGFGTSGRTGIES